MCSLHAEGLVVLSARSAGKTGEQTWPLIFQRAPCKHLLEFTVSSDLEAPPS